MSELSEQDQQLCDDAPAVYDDLRALYINCTLKPSPEPSHTRDYAGSRGWRTALICC